MKIIRKDVLVAIITNAVLLLGIHATEAEQASPPLSSARIIEILSSPDRTAADRTNDLRRKPEQMLGFIGIHPGLVALDLSAAGGYTTELLARSIGPTGKVYGQSRPRDPNQAPTSSSVPEGNSRPNLAPVATPAAPPAAPRPSPIALADRDAKLHEAGIPSAPIVALSRPFEDPVPSDLASEQIDLVTPGTGISESGTLHRIEEAFLRQEVEAAGFRLVEEGTFLRNPKDPRDKNTPDPPQPKDEFVLKFVRP
jgi:predicted methyltransferase